MPQNTILCRICLATEMPIFTIADTPLQAVYEKITNTPLNTGDLRPVVVCFVCCAQLKKCHKLMLTSAKAENMLSRILEGHPNATKNSKKLLTLVKRKTNGLRGSLSVTPVDLIDTLTFNTPIVVKNEPEDLEDIVKKELDYEECEGSPQIPQLASNLDDNVLNSKDAVVLQNICMKQEGYDVKLEPLEENYWQDSPTVTKTVIVKQEPSEGLLSDDTKLLATDWHEERTHLHEKHQETIGLQVPNGVPVLKSGLKKPNTIKYKSSERYFECNECQRQFRRKWHLKSHMVLHSSDRKKLSFKCNICHRLLSYRHTFDRHMRTHTGEKPYPCHFCPSRFTDSTVLKIHIRTHTGEKPYQCNVCERSFKQLNDLKRHARTHTGEKPYACDICHRRFNEKSKVTRHSKRHFGEKLTKCDLLKLYT